MIRFLFIGLFLYIGYRIVLLMTSAKKPLSTFAGERNASEDTHLDPICGIYVSEKEAVIGKHDGKRHYFCSMNCLEKYRDQLDHSLPK